MGLTERDLLRRLQASGVVPRDDQDQAAPAMVGPSLTDLADRVDQYVSQLAGGPRATTLERVDPFETSLLTTAPPARQPVEPLSRLGQQYGPERIAPGHSGTDLHGEAPAGGGVARLLAAGRVPPRVSETGVQDPFADREEPLRPTPFADTLPEPRAVDEIDPVARRLAEPGIPGMGTITPAAAEQLTAPRGHPLPGRSEVGPIDPVARPADPLLFDAHRPPSNAPAATAAGPTVGLQPPHPIAADETSVTPAEHRTGLAATAARMFVANLYPGPAQRPLEERALEQAEPGVAGAHPNILAGAATAGKVAKEAALFEVLGPVADAIMARVAGTGVAISSLPVVTRLADAIVDRAGVSPQVAGRVAGKVAGGIDAAISGAGKGAAFGALHDLVDEQHVTPEDVAAYGAAGGVLSGLFGMLGATGVSLSKALAAPGDVAAVTADPYAILGLSPDATTDEINAAFRRRAAPFHPDVNPSPAAEETFKTFAAARDQALGQAAGNAPAAQGASVREEPAPASTGGPVAPHNMDTEVPSPPSMSDLAQRVNAAMAGPEALGTEPQAAPLSDLGTNASLPATQVPQAAPGEASPRHAAAAPAPSEPAPTSTPEQRAQLEVQRQVRLRQEAGGAPHDADELGRMYEAAFEHEQKVRNGALPSLTELAERVEKHMNGGAAEASTAVARLDGLSPTLRQAFVDHFKDAPAILQQHLVPAFIEDYGVFRRQHQMGPDDAMLHVLAGVDPETHGPAEPSGLVDQLRARHLPAAVPATSERPSNEGQVKAEPSAAPVAKPAPKRTPQVAPLEGMTPLGVKAPESAPEPAVAPAAATPAVTEQAPAKPSRRPLKSEGVVGSWVLPRKGGGQVQDQAALAAYFTPGETVGPPHARDQVVKFEALPEGRFSVQVKGDDGRVRGHATPPSRAQLERTLRDRGTWPVATSVSNAPSEAPAQPEKPSAATAPTDIKATPAATPELTEAARAWIEGKAYVDGGGNYRLYTFPGGGTAAGPFKKHGPVAPWSKAVRRAFPKGEGFHEWAQKQAAPSVPAPAAEAPAAKAPESLAPSEKPTPPLPVSEQLATSRRTEQALAVEKEAELPLQRAKAAVHLAAHKTTVPRAWSGRVTRDGSPIISDRTTAIIANAVTKKGQAKLRQLERRTHTSAVPTSGMVFDREHGVWHGAVHGATQDAEIVGVVPAEEHGDLRTPLAIIARPDGSTVQVDADKLRLLQQTVAFDQLKVAPSGDQPVVAYRDGAPVGLVMPRREAHNQAVDVPAMRAHLAGATAVADEPGTDEAADSGTDHADQPAEPTRTTNHEASLFDAVTPAADRAESVHEQLTTLLRKLVREEMGSHTAAAPAPARGLEPAVSAEPVAGVEPRRAEQPATATHVPPAAPLTHVQEIEHLESTFGSIGEGEKVAREIAHQAGPLAQVSGLPETAERTEAGRRGKQMFAQVPATGHQIATRTGELLPKQMFRLLKAYRHPTAEYMHGVVTVGDRVVAHRMVTMGAIDGAQVNIGDFVELTAIAKRLGGVVAAAHNHPSGNPSPSSADLHLDARIQATVLGAGAEYKGHYVTGRGAGVLVEHDPRTGEPAQTRVTAAAGTRAWNDPNAKLLVGPEEAMDYFAQFPMDEKRADILLLNAQRRVIGWEVRPTIDLGHMDEWLPQLRRGTGAEAAIIGTWGDDAYRAAIAAARDPSLGILDVADIQHGVTATARGEVFPPVLSDEAHVSAYERTVPHAPSLSDAASTGPEAEPPTDRKPADAGGEYGLLRPVPTVEIVRMATELMGGQGPLVKRLQARGAFRAAPGEPAILLNPDLGKDPAQFARTLAHEVGHLIDFLPDHTVARGNILGRLASLKKYMQQTVDAVPTDPSKALTKRDRIALQKEAQRAAGPRPIKGSAAVNVWQKEVARIYAEKVEAEMDARGLVGRDRIHEELQLLSEWWRPFDRSTASDHHIKYRESAAEVYADAMSVLLNSPGSLQEQAPTFFSAFLSYLDRKPEVRAAYMELQRLLAPGNEAEAAAVRSADIRADFKRGEDVMRAADAGARPKQGFIRYLKQAVLARQAPVTDAEAKRLGKSVLPVETRRSVKLALEEHNHADNDNALLMDRVDTDVAAPLRAAGVTMDDAGEYLMLSRIAEGDRGGMAEKAREAIMDIVGESSWPKAKAAYEKLASAAGDEVGGGGDAEFDPDLLELADSGLLNPKGHTPETARESLAALHAKLGSGGYRALEGAMRALRAMQYELASAAADAGVYNRAFFDKTITPNRDGYAPFAVLDYFNGRVSGGVRQQVGTVKGISNPFVVGIMKMMSLNRMIARQRAAVAVLKYAPTDFPGEIGDEQVIDRFHRETRPGYGRENVRYYVDGHLRYREMPEYTAAVLSSRDLGALQRAADALGSRTYKIFHPLWVGWNIGWQVTNPPRDFKRTFTQALPMARAAAGQSPLKRALAAPADLLWNLPKAYIAARSPAWRYARHGEISPIVREMLEGRAMGQLFARPTAAELKEDSKYERLLGQFLPSRGERPAWRKVSGILSDLGAFQEVLGKVAAYHAISDVRGPLAPAGLGDQERAATTREFAGTPDSRVRGRAADATNAVFTYSNVVLAGLRSGATVASHPRTRGDYWLRATVSDFWWKGMMAAAAFGALGTFWKEYMRRIPEYDKEKYLILPTGWHTEEDGTWKPRYMKVPHDDFIRPIAASLWAVLHEHGAEHKLAAPARTFGGDLPSLTPLFRLPIQWGEAVSGTDPRDSFRGRDVVPKTEWDAGGWPKWKEMLRYTLNDFGILGQALGYFTNDVPQGEERSLEEKLEQSIPGVSRLVKISDSGLREEERDALVAADQLKAKARAQMTESDRRQVSERGRLNRLHALGRTTPAENEKRAQLNVWYNDSYMPKLRAAQREEGIDVPDRSGRPMRPARPLPPLRPRRP